MDCKINPEFLRTLLKYVKTTYLPEKRHNPKYPDSFTSGDLHFFAPEVAKLSAAFTFERSERHANYFSTKEARSSYLLYFLMPNMLKVEWILKQQHMVDLFADEPEVRIADIGCGPCPGLLAAEQYWQEHAPQQKIKCMGMDQNGSSLKDGTALFKALSNNRPESTITTKTATLAQTRKALGNDRFHILIVANVLNEMSDTQERYEFICKLIDQHLAPNGRLIIIEPALQRTTRDLMLLRDQLVTETKIATVLAPCLHQALCPMRANNPRDWCHTYVNWERPQVIADLDMLIGNKKDYLKMSYMVMKPVANAINLAKNVWRVVSAPMKSKGKLEILFCGQKDGNLLRVTRQDKDRSKFNIALDQLQRGDIVEYAGDGKCMRETIVALRSIT